MEPLDKPHTDSERGGVGSGSRHSAASSDGGRENRSSTSSDADSVSWNSPVRSIADGSSTGVSNTEIVGVRDDGRVSSASDCSVDVDLEAGVPDSKVHLAISGRDCRICHLSFDATNHVESEAPIELGCSCKDDLAAAHKQCAEAWFKIKGNKTCEICGSTARNVAGASDAELVEQWNEANEAASAAAAGPTPSSETRNFWQGHRFLNFLLACMVFAFVISWLFHFNIPS